MNWHVKHFDDYHDIESKTHKAIELGCFPAKGYGYCRYFGLFYKGRKPSLDKVFASVLKKVCVTPIRHARTGIDITCSANELKEELKEHLCK